jgi:hypothetical protein
MRFDLLKQRQGSVDIHRHLLRERPRVSGEITVLEIRDDGGGRTIVVARHVQHGGCVEVLYEPRLVWMCEGRFVLAGFERIQRDGQLISYAQSWLLEAKVVDAFTDKVQPTRDKLQMR